MQDPEPTPSSCCPDFQARFAEWTACAEKSVREEPVKTAGLAFVAGILLTALPVGRLLGGVVRLILALIKPALILLGIVKIVEEFDRRTKS